MKYWVLTDTHFGHERMHDYCQRPHDFEERILRQARHKIGLDDVLIHLGDFCIGNDAHWHSKFMMACNGRRWLVRGNHDRKSNTWYHDRGWDCVASEIHLDVFGKQIILTHKPLPADTQGEFVNVHGHHHNTGHHQEDGVDERRRLVFIEHEYTPISLRKIVGA